MQLTLPDTVTVRIEVSSEADALFEEVCRQASDAQRVEQTKEGDIIVMPPAGNESSFRNSDILFELVLWNKQAQNGYCFGPDTAFVLPDGSKKGADASWIPKEVVAALPRSERERFMKVAPWFVIELLSRTDRLGNAHQKMQEWIANGVSLGWLIDAKDRRAWIYTPAGVRTLTEPATLEGEGRLSGFRLALAEVYRGLA